MENQAEIAKEVIAAWKERSETITKIVSAICKFQGALEPVKKDSANPYFKSKYADLASVWDAIREHLAKNDLCVLQEPSTSGTKLILTTTIMHSSGEYIRSSLEFPVTKQDPQGYGSAITYARRYALQSITGIAPEDDDGNAASGTKPSRPNPYERAPVECSVKVEPQEKYTKKQKLTQEAMAANKAYQYDLHGIGNNCKTEADKKATWTIAQRDYGAIAVDKVAYCFQPIPEWYDHWVNEMEINKRQPKDDFDSDELPDFELGAKTV